MSWKSGAVRGTLTVGQKVRTGVIFETHGDFSSSGNDAGAQLLLASPESPGGEISSSEQTKVCRLDGTWEYRVLLSNIGTKSTTWIMEGGSFE